MATYNTLIKKRNASNTGWDSILPITTAENVLINEQGDTVATHMAEYTKYHNTAGTANALTVSIGTGLTFDLTKDGNLLHINPSLTNTGAATINPSGQGTKAVKKFDVDTDTFVDVEADDIKKNHQTTLRWDLTNDFFVLAPRGGSGSNIKSIQRYKVEHTGSFIRSTIQHTINEVIPENTEVRLLGFNAGRSQAEDGATVRLISSTKVETTCQLGYMDTGTTGTVSFEVIEYHKLKSKQSYMTTILSGKTTVEQSISEVDTDKTVLSFNGFVNDVSGSYSATYIPYIHLKNATVVEASRRDTVGSVVVYFDVLEVE